MRNSESVETIKTRLPWGLLLLVSILTFLAYIPSLYGPFVFDDLNNIVENDTLKHFPPQLHWLNPTSRWVVSLTFSVNYLVSGLNPWAYRATNVLLHIGCGWLIAKLTQQIILSRQKRFELHGWGTDDFVLSVTTLWMLHPLASSAVAYIVQRSEILAACSIVAFVLAIILDSKSQDRRWQWIGIGVLFAGICCKTNAVSALPIGLLMDRYLLGTPWQQLFKRRGVVYLLPVLLAVVSAWFLLPGIRRGDAGVGFSEQIPTLPIFLATQCRVLWHYIALCFYPIGLCIDYRWPPVTSVASAIPWIGLTLAFCCVGCWLLRRDSIVGWLILCVLLLLAPTSTLIPLTDLAVDHRMYLATAAVMGASVVAIRSILSRTSNSLFATRWKKWTLIVSVALFFWIRTNVRASDWSTGFSLWRSTAEVVPKNPRALQNLTSTAKEEGRLPDLHRFLVTLRNRQILEGDRSPVVASRLGEELLKAGNPSEAEPLLEEAIAGLSPSGPIDERQEHAAARINLALLLLQRSEANEAETHLEQGIQSDPKQPFAYAMLGDLAMKKADFHSAVKYFEAALNLSPHWVQVERDLSIAKDALQKAKEPNL